MGSYLADSEFCSDEVFLNDGSGVFTLDAVNTTPLSSNYSPYRSADAYFNDLNGDGHATLYHADLTGDNYKDIFMCAGHMRPRLFTRTSAVSGWTSVTDSPLVSEGPCLAAMIADLNEVRTQPVRCGVHAI